MATANSETKKRRIHNPTSEKTRQAPQKSSKSTRIRPSAHYTAKPSSPLTSHKSSSTAKPYLSSSQLLELWTIWKYDQRLPSKTSRNAWALSRGADPEKVDTWFYRRKTAARKAGNPLSDETYELPLDAPQEKEKTAKEEHLSTVTDDFSVPSSDTILPSSSPKFHSSTVKGPSSDSSRTNASDHVSSSHLLSSSSNNRFRAPLLGAYSRDSIEPSTPSTVTQRKSTRSPSCELYEYRTSFTSVDSNISSSPIVPALTISHQWRCNESNQAGETPESLSKDIPRLFCNQGDDAVSDFTCYLCTFISDSDADPSLPSSSASSSSSSINNINPSSDKMVPTYVSPTYVPLQSNSDSVMELSAIPFLFRSPDLISSLISNEQAVHWAVRPPLNWHDLEEHLEAVFRESHLHLPRSDKINLPLLNVTELSQEDLPCSLLGALDQEDEE